MPTITQNQNTQYMSPNPAEYNNYASLYQNAQMNQQINNQPNGNGNWPYPQQNSNINYNNGNIQQPMNAPMNQAPMNQATMNQQQINNQPMNGGMNQPINGHINPQNMNPQTYQNNNPNIYQPNGNNQFSNNPNNNNVNYNSNYISPNNIQQQYTTIASTLSAPNLQEQLEAGPGQFPQKQHSAPPQPYANNYMPANIPQNVEQQGQFNSNNASFNNPNNNPNNNPYPSYPNANPNQYQNSKFLGTNNQYSPPNGQNNYYSQNGMNGNQGHQRTSSQTQIQQQQQQLHPQQQQQYNQQQAMINNGSNNGSKIEDVSAAIPPLSAQISNGSGHSDERSINVNNNNGNNNGNNNNGGQIHIEDIKRNTIIIDPWILDIRVIINEINETKINCLNKLRRYNPKMSAEVFNDLMNKKKELEKEYNSFYKTKQELYNLNVEMLTKEEEDQMNKTNNDLNNNNKKDYNKLKLLQKQKFDNLINKKKKGLEQRFKEFAQDRAEIIVFKVKQYETNERQKLMNEIKFNNDLEFDKEPTYIDLMSSNNLSLNDKTKLNEDLTNYRNKMKQDYLDFYKKQVEYFRNKIQPK